MMYKISYVVLCVVVAPLIISSIASDLYFILELAIITFILFS